MAKKYTDKFNFGQLTPKELETVGSLHKKYNDADKKWMKSIKEGL